MFGFLLKFLIGVQRYNLFGTNDTVDGLSNHNKFIYNNSRVTIEDGQEEL